MIFFLFGLCGLFVLWHTYRQSQLFLPFEVRRVSFKKSFFLHFIQIATVCICIYMVFFKTSSFDILAQKMPRYSYFIDMSPSMFVCDEDNGVSRLKKGIEIVKECSESMHDHLVALSGFSSQTTQFLPFVSSSSDVLKKTIDYLNGIDLVTGVASFENIFQKILTESDKEITYVVLSDGEVLSDKDQNLKLLQKLHRKMIDHQLNIIVIILGSPHGDVIPINPWKEQGIVSKADSELFLNSGFFVIESLGKSSCEVMELIKNNSMNDCFKNSCRMFFYESGIFIFSMLLYFISDYFLKVS